MNLFAGPLPSPRKSGPPRHSGPESPALKECASKCGLQPCAPDREIVHIVTSLAIAAAGLVLLYFGGEWVVRGAASLALRLGLSPLAVGLTVVSMGTSAPELVVSLDAALGGANDIAVGNVVGSNIANLGLILGLSAMLNGARVQATLVRFDGPLVLVISLLMLSMLYDGVVTRLEGLSFLFGLVTYVAVTLILGGHETEIVQKEFAATVPRRPVPLRDSLLRVAAGTAALAAGGHLLVGSAVALASSVGISQAVIGITLVAIGTSLPEMATSLVAAARGQTDIAVGNLVGSNIFNMLGILGATALVQPLQRGEVGWDSLWTMVAFAAALIPMMYTGLRLTRAEGGILLAGYCGYMIWLFRA